MKKLLLLFMVLLCSCSKNAEPINAWETPSPQDDPPPIISINDTSITSKQAAYVANTFLDNQNPTTKNSIQSREITTINPINDNNGQPLMYVINFKEKGFVIVSATTSYIPVLAYSDESSFDCNDNFTKTGVTLWLEETTNSIKNADILCDEEKFKIRNMWMNYQTQTTNTPSQTKAQGDASDAFHTRVTKLRNENPGYNFYPLSNTSSSMFPLSSTYDELCNLADGYNSPREYTIIGIKNQDKFQTTGPLIGTSWHQGTPYNELVPSKYAGCVPIAMAQIMKYHKWPNNYDWNNMKSSGATYDTQRLIYDIGLQAGTKYTEDGSGTTDRKAKNAFESFGYNATLSDHDFTNVRNEIRWYNRPVYMSGISHLIFPTDAHAWVCEGVKTGYISVNYLVEFIYGGPGYYSFSNYGHYPSESAYEYMSFYMNWGWGDRYNGWYVYNSAQPDGSSSNYNKMRKDIYVRPN